MTAFSELSVPPHVAAYVCAKYGVTPEEVAALGVVHKPKKSETPFVPGVLGDIR
jgi:hypothetical protein